MTTHDMPGDPGDFLILNIHCKKCGNDFDGKFKIINFFIRPEELEPGDESDFNGYIGSSDCPKCGERAFRKGKLKDICGDFGIEKTTWYKRKDS